MSVGPMYQNFAAVLGALENGAAHARVSSLLRDLVQACVDDDATGGKGSGKLAIELSITAERGVVSIRHALKVKEPIQRAGVTIFYPTPDGNLAAQDPRQAILPLRSVEEPTTRAI